MKSNDNSLVMMTKVMLLRFVCVVIHNEGFGMLELLLEGYYDLYFRIEFQSANNSFRRMQLHLSHYLIIC